MSGFRQICLASIYALSVCAMGAMPGMLSAEEKFPTRPIQLIVPAPAGGSLDIGIRIMQQPLSANLGVPLVIVNRTGASGVVGMSSVANATPDGYTLGATSSSAITVVHLTSPNLPYGNRDFITIGNYAVDVGAIVVRADAPWKTFDELVDYARKNPGKLTSGSYGVGSLSALNVEAVKSTYGLDILDVPFQGAPQAILAVLGKQIDIGAAPYSAVISFLKDGSLRALVTSADERLPPWPDVPTLSEKGVRHAKLKLVLGLYAPAGTPNPVVATLSDALRQAIKDPAASAALEKAGMFTQYDDGDTARQLLDSEYDDVMSLGREMKLVK